MITWKSASSIMEHIIFLRNWLINISEFNVMLLPSWHNSALKSATCPLWNRVLPVAEASFLWPDSPRTSPGNEPEKPYRRRTIVPSSPMEWPSWTWWNHSWHSHLKSRLFVIHSSVLLSCINIMPFCEFRVTALFFGCFPSGSTEWGPPRQTHRLW